MKEQFKKDWLTLIISFLVGFIPFLVTMDCYYCMLGPIVYGIYLIWTDSKSNKHNDNKHNN